ncbi:MAG: bacterial Ig-like domain-containing protein [Bacteroidaceae bacterium]|nr:bacterial Ig-like domain-containing protein [Bacteroidaceae bacterium]
MKQKLLTKLWLRVWMLVAVMTTALTGTAWAEETINFADLGLENGVQYTDPFDGGDFTVTFAGGANDGKYYTTGSGIRLYGNGTMTIASEKTIESITITYDGSNKPSDGTVVNVGTYDASTGVWTGAENEIVFTRPSGSGHWRIQSISVTYASGGSSAVATTTTIDATGITNTDVYEGTEAGSLAATVVDNDENKVEGATVTWSGNNDAVATIDEDGNVTLVAAGTVKFTAAYAGVKDEYKASSATYEMTVTDSTPFTGGDIVFESAVLNSDTETSLTKSVVTITGSKLASAYYQAYKNTDFTISTTFGNITKIVFECTSTYPASGFAEADGFVTDGDNGTWTGEAKTVTLTASNKQVRMTKITVTVEAETPKVLDFITLSGDYPTTFHVGDAFSHEGIVVTATYEDETTRNVTASAEFTGYDMANAGEQTVTVSYTENEVTKTATYDINVNAPATLLSISLSGTYPTEFGQGDAFSSEGIIVTANFDDSTTADVTAEATFTGYDMDVLGEQTVTVSYEGQEATYTITIVEKKGTVINPYTVAEARAAIDEGTGVTGVYAKGIVSKIVTAYNSQFGNITYNISVDGTTEGEQLQAYRGFSFDGAWFTSEYDVMVGDEVVIYGNLKKYKTTYEFDANNYLISLVRKPIKVTIGEAGYATAYMPYPITFAGGGTPDAEDLPTPVGAWTFNDSENPLAGTGTATLTPANHSTAKPTWLETKESLEEANIEVIDGGLNLPKGSSLLMNTNNGATSFDRYTVMFDICSDDMSGYTPLWQNSMDDSKDGSLFIKNGQMGLGGSLGYNGNFSAGNWYRVVLVIDTPNKAALYVDGELLSSCEHTDSYNKHWLLQGPGAVFFADEDGEEKAIKVTGLRFWDVPFTPEQVAALGTVAEDIASEEDPEIVTIPETTGAWTFEGGTPNGTGVATMTATAGVVANEDGSITVDENNSLELTTNLPEESLSSYTLMMDVKFPDVARYTALIQTDLDNVNDAGLFVHNGQIGINSAGMYYHGALENDTWYRIIFVVKDLYAEEYVDGKLVGKSSAPLDKWGIGTGLFLFEDENDDNDEGVATVKGIQFWNEALTPLQIAMLGTVGSDGTVKAYTGQITDNYLSLTEVEGTIPAKTPVILKGAPGTYFFEIGGNAAEVGENDLKGTFEEIDAVGKYVLAKPEGEQVGFYQAESGTIAAGKAYLEVPDASGIKVFYFGGESATGINAIDNEQLTIDNAAIYNLSGQRVSKAQKGIYIINGKKVLVK